MPGWGRVVRRRPGACAALGFVLLSVGLWPGRVPQFAVYAPTEGAVDRP